MLGPNHTVNTKRFSSDVDDKKTYPSSTFNIEGLEVYIEKADASTSAVYGEDAAIDLYRMITDGVVDLKVGDLVIDDNSREYTVRGVNDYSGNLGISNHTEAIIVVKHDTNQS